MQFIDFIVTGLFEAWNSKITCLYLKSYHHHHHHHSTDYVDITEVIGELESNYKFWKDASSTSEPTTEV